LIGKSGANGGDEREKSPKVRLAAETALERIIKTGQYVRRGALITHRIMANYVLHFRDSYLMIVEVEEMDSWIFKIFFLSLPF
jgi:hypothetical protein